MRQFGELIDFSETPGPHRTARRRSSASTRREILGELGYRDAEIDALKEKSVVYWPDDDYLTRFTN